MNEGNEILRRLVDGARDDDGVLANDLLRALFRGYPVSNLLRLLHSTNAEQVRIGAWVLSELGVRGRELRNELPALLGSGLPYVRFYAIDSALTCCTEDDGATVALVLHLLSDPHQGVRHKATDFLVRADKHQLLGALRTMQQTPVPNPTLVTSIQWLLSASALDLGAIQKKLEHESPIVRRFGLAAILRTPHTPTEMKAMALASADRELAELARRRLER